MARDTGHARLSLPTCPVQADASPTLGITLAYARAKAKAKAQAKSKQQGQRQGIARVAVSHGASKLHSIGLRYKVLIVWPRSARGQVLSSHEVLRAVLLGYEFRRGRNVRSLLVLVSETARRY